MNIYYGFVIASVFSLIGVTAILLHSLHKLKEHPEKRAEITSRMFIKNAIIDIIPIVLIVYSYSYLTKHDMPKSAEIMPLFVLIGAIVVAFMFVCLSYSQLIRKKELDDETKKVIEETMSIGQFLLLAVPIFSILSLFIL